MARRIKGGFNNLNSLAKSNIPAKQDSTAVLIFISFMLVIVAILGYLVYRFYRLDKKHLKCKDTRFGCCPDGKTAKQSADDKCELVDGCKVTLYGCCPDGKTTKISEDDKCE